MCIFAGEYMKCVLLLFLYHFEMMGDALDRSQSTMVRANMSPPFPCGSKPGS